MSRVLASLCCLIAAVLPSPLGAEEPGKAITMAAFGHRILPASRTEGDTWDGAWLADDSVYLQFNDGMGFLRSGRRFVRNGIVELSGTPEDPSSLSGVNLNPGKHGSFLGDTYSTGIYEVDGILYQNLVYSIQRPPYYLFYNGST